MQVQTRIIGRRRPIASITAGYGRATCYRRNRVVRLSVWYIPVKGGYSAVGKVNRGPSREHWQTDVRLETTEISTSLRGPT